MKWHMCTHKAEVAGSQERPVVLSRVGRGPCGPCRPEWDLWEGAAGTRPLCPQVGGWGGPEAPLKERTRDRGLEDGGGGAQAQTHADPSLSGKTERRLRP